MIALIDADSLVYKVCFALEDKVVWNFAEVAAGLEEPDDDYFTNLEQIKKTFDGFIDNILFATGCDGAWIVLSGEGNFRLNLPISYKGNRKLARKPLGLDELRSHIEENYEVTFAHGMEADDVVVYAKTTYPEDYILCAIDKDVLHQTVGTHYDYGRDEEVTVDEWEAVRFAYFQTLTGDTVDGYSGVKGIGVVKAEKILAGCTTEKELWKAVVDTYEAKGQTEEEAILTMRLANMHQFDGEKIVLWKPPALEFELTKEIT